MIIALSKIRFYTPCNLVDVDADLLQLCGLRPDGAGVDMDDIAVNQHFPGVGRKVLCAKLGHLLLDQRPFLRRHRDAQHKLPFSVCHFRTSIHSGVWGLPQDTNGKPFAGSVTPMLAVFVLLPLKSVLTPRKYPQNPGFSENRTKKERAQPCVLPKTKQRVVMHPPFRHSSVEFEWPRQSRP